MSLTGLLTEHEKGHIQENKGPQSSHTGKSLPSTDDDLPPPVNCLWSVHIIWSELPTIGQKVQRNDRDLGGGSNDPPHPYYVGMSKVNSLILGGFL